MKLTNQNQETKEALLKTFGFNNSDKSELFKTFGFQKSEQDSGSSESQIALFTYRIKHLTEHLSVKKKDYATKLGLLKLVGKRKRLLAYLKKVDLSRYRDIITSLGLRK
ncbi:30S ribosomal protein S15 [Cardinium endosymbiont of Oedothorax gibbosus]|uniref:30S ribosomal protein S15 n=1 Tax=Cardinium endosymbiont of Oedothorax gibbosus TaxID=931101 RepID=UPI002024DADD|nr:30S ribosomal protein S15 [Cardinium endosymbiont of Oedothorax gibbosus]CAH2560129.1 30S ribosomal protein S15 [Cardinium endosymbiont of Oedothorax gibbosus]